jgi:hypothetical protein
VSDLEQIEAIIAKNLTITDQRLMDGVIGAVLDAIAAHRDACARLCEEHKALRLSEIIRARGEYADADIALSNQEGRDGMSKHMYVYVNGRLTAVESNMEFAIPYWAKRKQDNKRITWKFV